VFLNFYRACRDGRDMYNVRGYLLTAARSRCINELRVSRRFGEIEHIPELGHEPDPANYDLAEHLQQALQQIAPQYRETFLLFEIEGYSYDEIASTLDISLGVVKNRIYRAKQALQKILKPLLNNE
jgi:RNA polymerase sigma-70 factor (ECF subfamily)